MKMISDLFEPDILVGAEGVLIDGIEALCKWENDIIEVRAKRKTVTVKGTNLRLEYKSLDALMVRGNVETIEFARRKK